MRISSLPQFMSCAASQGATDEIRINTAPSERGNAWHAVKDLIVAGSMDDSRVQIIAAKFNQPVEEIERAVEALAWLAEREMEGWEEIVEGEVSFEAGGMKFVGHPDLARIHRADRKAALIDLKSGWGEVFVEKNWQLIGYALGLIDRDPTIETVAVMLWKPAFWRFEGVTYTRDTLEEFRKLIAAQVNRTDYTVGEHCSYCALRASCPAYHRTLASIHRELPQPVWIGGLAPSEVGELKIKADLFAKWVKEVQDAIRKRAMDEPIPLPDGRVYGPLETPKREIVITLESWELLKQLEGLADFINVPLGAVDEAVRSMKRKEHGGKPPRGSLKEAVDQFFGALIRAGGLKKSFEKQVRVYDPAKIQKELEEEGNG